MSSQVPIRVAGKPVEVALTAVSRQTVRITIRNIENGPPAPVAADGALLQETWPPALARITSVTAKRAVRWGDLRLTVSADPLTIRAEGSGGRFIQQLQFDPITGRSLFQEANRRCLGSARAARNSIGAVILIPWAADRPLTSWEHTARESRCSFLIGSSGFGLYIHAPLGGFDLTANPGHFTPHEGATALPIDVFVIGTDDPASMVREYAGITGLPEMPPLWSLGYQQSHRTLGSPAEILEEARTFREKKRPCDAMIYLGTDFCPNGWNTHNGEFTFNSQAFPDPQKAIESLHDEHFKVVLHIVIEGHRLTGTVGDACTAPALPTGRTPEGRWPPDRQVSCY